MPVKNLKPDHACMVLTFAHILLFTISDNVKQQNFNFFGPVVSLIFAEYG